MQHITLYHYTLATHLTSISREGLRASIRQMGDPMSDALQGNGQYCTDLTPRETEGFTRSELAQALFRLPYRWDNLEKQIGWVKIAIAVTATDDVDPLYPGVVATVYTHRRIWLIANNVTLNPAYIVETGRLSI